MHGLLTPRTCAARCYVPRNLGAVGA
jgi:hypothetical protein